LDIFLIVSIFILFGIIPTVDRTFLIFVMFGVILVSIMIIPWQYYCFVEHKTQADDGQIIPRAMFMALALIVGLISILVISF